MRLAACLLAVLAAACHPSATIERTMPVANLQSYRTIGLRVRSTAFASQGEAMFLESALRQDLQQQCGFEQIAPPGAPADVFLDLNITATGRGGSGWIQNANLATIDTLLVLSDGQNGELLGTARIHGKSSGMIVNNNAPETEAVNVVAKTVADLLAKSGCAGPRIARTETPPPGPDGTAGSGAAAGSDAGSGTGSGSAVVATTVDPAKKAQAEALDEQGKDKLRSADIAGALALFQQANALSPDPRYEFNVCLTLEAQEHWDEAGTACKQAKAMNPEPRLSAKIDHRLDLIAHRQ